MSRGEATRFFVPSCVVQIPPVYRRVLSYRVQIVEHGKPNMFSMEAISESRTVVRWDNDRVGIGKRKKRKAICNEMYSD